MTAPMRPPVPQSGHRLPGVPRLCCILVQAELADVLSFVRAEAQLQPRALHELTGPDARVDRSFGPQAAHLTQFPDRDFIRDTFALRGWRRVSRLRSNPEFVLFEEHLDQVTDVNLRHLQFWTGGPAYLVRSQIAPYGLNKEHATVLGVVDAIGEHVFTAARADAMRSISYISWVGPKELHEWGTPWDFEDSHEGVDPALCLTRDRICSYLERIGIDPEASFDRRELDDTVLFTEDHPGTPVAPDPAAGERYREMVEGIGWFPRVQAGTWF